VIRQAFFNIRIFLQAKLHQLFDPLLRRRTFHRADEPVPFGSDGLVRWQAGSVDEALDVGDRLLVEPGNTPGHGVDERVEFSIG